MIRDNKPKGSLRILNTREKKEINKRIFEQWGCELDKGFVFLLSNKNKLYIADKDIGRVSVSDMRVDNIGLYVATVDDNSVRLSIEGSQIIGPHARKNVVGVDDVQMREWFRGNDLRVKVEGGISGFVIIRHGRDFIGCGKVTEKGILNFVPKTRRILSVC